MTQNLVMSKSPCGATSGIHHAAVAAFGFVDICKDNCFDFAGPFGSAFFLPIKFPELAEGNIIRI